MNEKITIEIQDGKTTVTIYGDVDIVQKKSNGIVKVVDDGEITADQYTFLQKHKYTDIMMPKTSLEAQKIIADIRLVELAKKHGLTTKPVYAGIPIPKDFSLVKRGRGRPRKVG